MDYLGHEVSGEGVRPLSAKIMALKHWPTPVNLDELRSFLGLACYYKHFIPDNSKHAAPLNLLTRKDTPFFWGDMQHDAFNHLKNALVTFPCLGTIQRQGQLVVHTDACDVAIGAILHQVQDGAERFLGYYSKSLNSDHEIIARPRKSCWPLWPCYM